MGEQVGGEYFVCAWIPRYVSTLSNCSKIDEQIIFGAATLELWWLCYWLKLWWHCNTTYCNLMSLVDWNHTYMSYDCSIFVCMFLRIEHGYVCLFIYLTPFPSQCSKWGTNKSEILILQQAVNVPLEILLLVLFFWYEDVNFVEVQLINGEFQVFLGPANDITGGDFEVFFIFPVRRNQTGSPNWRIKKIYQVNFWKVGKDFCGSVLFRVGDMHQYFNCTVILSQWLMQNGLTEF